MKITFWGTRGSIPTPGQRTVRYGGNTACVEVRDRAGELLILDAGTGLRELGMALQGNGPHSIDLLLSHLHWDHIQGIPFFRPAYDAASELRIYGPRQAHPLRQLLGIGMDDPFFPVDLDGLPVKLDVHELDSGQKRSVGKFHVSAARVFHPAPALAYRVEADGRALVYATDTEDPAGRQNPVARLAAGAHTLIHDAQYLNGDLKPGYGHSTVDTALEVALAAKVERLVLYHHDPDRTDDSLDQIERELQEKAHARDPRLEVVAASEGLELDI